MATVLKYEKPELEERRSQLLRQEEDLKMKLDQLQEVLLHELANAQGDILQNKVIPVLTSNLNSILYIFSSRKGLIVYILAC